MIDRFYIPRMKYNTPLVLAVTLSLSAGAHAGVIASNTTSDATNVTEVNQWGFDTTNHGVQGHASGVYPEWGAYCLAQSFTTGALGGVNQLSSISVGTAGAVTASTVSAYLYETTTGALPDNNYWKVAATPAATATVSLSAAAGPTTVTFDFSSAGLTLKENTTYVFYLRPTTGSAFTWAGSSTNSYAGGEAMGVFADANLGGGPGFWTGNLNSVASTDITGDRVFSVATSGTFEIPLDPQDGGRVFEGIGALSAGASSRLLIDYPEPQRSEVLDFLFKPNFGASLPHLKVEIGGEINSTCGSEPSHQRTREDLNFQRGYEWWLMKEAKTRRPDILLDALPWGAPGWIGNGSYYSQDMADYIARFIQGAKSEHGLDIHYTGIWNERPYDAAWIKLLRRTLNDNGLNQVEIVAADEFNMNWRIADDAANDSELNQAIAVFGEHYPLQYTMPSAVAKASGKRLWASEEGPWRGDWQGAKAIASQLNRNYVQGKITKSITWSLVSSYYDSLRLPDSGMMRAKEPWSGHYEVQPAVWVIAHHNQFAKPGWRYLDQACRMLPSGGSVVAMASPSGTDASVVIETIGAAGDQTFTLNVDASLTSREWQLWKTDQTESFIHVGVQSLIDGKLTLELAPDSVYSLTTTTGQAKGVKQAPASQKFPMPYSDDFESYAIGRTPRYFSDQAGTFEVIHRADGQGKALEQVLRAPGIEWENRPEQFHPFTVIGAPDAKDYLVSVDVEAADGVTVALIGRYGRIQHSESSAFAKGYRLEVTAGSGAWKLSKPDAILAQGTSPFPANTWHNLQLEARGTTLICRINGTVVAQAQDSTHFEGLAGLAAGYAGARFDNFVLSNFDGAYLWGGGNGTWIDTSATGWNGGPPASGDSATINTGTVTNTGSNQQAGVALTIGSAGVLNDGGNYIYFGPSGSLTLNGGTIHITRPDIGFGWYAASLSPVVNANSGSSSITGSAGIRLEGDTTFTGDGNLTISHGLHNYTDGYGSFPATSITKTGSGTLTLSGVNDYTGPTIVLAGMLRLGNGSSNSNLADSANVLLTAAAKLHLDFNGTDTVNALSVGGVAKPPGVYSSSNSDFITGPGTLTVLSTQVSDYDSWKSPLNLAGGPDEDDDSDGLSNFEEYAFGLDPRNSSSVRTVTTLALKTTGTFTYTRRKTSLSGLSYKVWTSTDLDDWTEDTSASQNATSIPGTDKESVEVTLSPERLGNDRLFVRIMAA
jgi:autotransporter-associated beta strand protein